MREAQLKTRTSVGGLLVVLLAVSIGWWHHATGARFSATVRRISTFGLSGCSRELKGFGWSSSGPFCTGAEGKPAFRLSIQNQGGRGAWATSCLVQGLDATGAPIPDAVSWVPIDLRTPGVGRRGPFLDSGASVTFDWFLQTVPSQPVTAYRATCNPVTYHGPEPV